MKTTIKIFAGWFLFAALLSPVVYGQSRPVPKAELNVLAMKSVPDGHYRVNLQSGGTERFINLQVKDNLATCVNSSDPGLKGLTGKFELIGNGVFLVALRNREHAASQWWLFRPDGTATVKEVPDRGEKQTAVPVPDDSLERPTTPH